MTIPVGRTSCGYCGTVVDDPPVTWIRELDGRRGEIWYCERCSREHLRAIESRLPQEWW